MISAALAWKAIGVIGAIVFYGRFYVQWIYSEMNRRSVMPVVFWYMSSVGSVMLLAFAVWSQSPLGALGQNLNIVIYSRNLVHIWREKGTLSKAKDIGIHVTVIAIGLVAVGFVAYTWLQEYQLTKEATAETAKQTWFWLGIGLLGQAFFAARFLIQWIITEYKRQSVVPPIFWHLSLAASLLQGAAFAQRQEWIFAVGMAATMLIYARNIWFIHFMPEKAAMHAAKS